MKNNLLILLRIRDKQAVTNALVVPMTWGALHALLGIPKANNDDILSSLPESQAGVVRHKDAFEAYNHGYDLVMSMEIKKAA